LLEEEWRRLPISYAHRERQWIDRTVAVPVSSVEFAVAEGMVAYATRQADMYRALAERAEITRTELKLRKGKKRKVFQPSWDPILPLEEEAAVHLEEGNEDDDEEEDDERGDVESDEELLMGGEVDED
jgi:hypothetical protein